MIRRVLGRRGLAQLVPVAQSAGAQAAAGPAGYVNLYREHLEQRAARQEARVQYLRDLCEVVGHNQRKTRKELLQLFNARLLKKHGVSIGLSRFSDLLQELRERKKLVTIQNTESKKGRQQWVFMTHQVWLKTVHEPKEHQKFLKRKQYAHLSEQEKAWMYKTRKQKLVEHIKMKDQQKKTRYDRRVDTVDSKELDSVLNVKRKLTTNQKNMQKKKFAKGIVYGNVKAKSKE